MLEHKPTRPFPVRTHGELSNPDGVAAVRERLAAKSAGYRAAVADPFAVIASGRREADIPF